MERIPALEGSAPIDVIELDGALERLQLSTNSWRTAASSAHGGNVDHEDDLATFDAQMKLVGPARAMCPRHQGSGDRLRWPPTCWKIVAGKSASLGTSFAVVFMPLAHARDCEASMGERSRLREASVAS